MTGTLWQPITEGELHLEAGGSIVRKVFIGPRDQSLANARREFEYLQRLWSALVELPHVTCPEPLELVEDGEVAVRMRRMPGELLQTYLLSRRHPDILLARLAVSVVDVHEAYVNTFHEPHFDFILANMLYDESAGVLTLLDFSRPRHHVVTTAVADPAVVAFGGLLGSALYAASFPSGWWRVRHTRQAGAVAGGALAELEQRHGPVDPAALESAAWDSYRRAFAMTPLSRHPWYRGPGRLVAALALRSARRRPA
jgi:hypothetical protein